MLSSLSGSSSRFYSKSKVSNLIERVLSERKDGLLTEHEVWSIIGDLGFSISQHKYAPVGSDPSSVVNSITSDRLVAKGVVRSRKDNSLITHKTDIGAIQFNVPRTVDGVHSAMKTFESRFGPDSPYKLDGILFVEMMKMSGDFGTEMLVSGYQDPFFGPTICYGFGGTIVEYLKDKMRPDNAQLFIPALFNHKATYEHALSELPVAQLCEGKARGTKQHLDHSILVPTLRNLQSLISDYSNYSKGSKYIIDEIEVNPTVAINRKMWALDGVMRVSRRAAIPYLSPTTTSKPLEKIRSLMAPKSIIVAGASSKNLMNPGSVILGEALKAGVKDIYAIHPKAKKLLGHPAYPSLKAIVKARGGKPVDLLSVCIPAKSAGKLVNDAFDVHAAEAIQVVSGGFGETEHGAKMQTQLHDKLFAMPNERRPVVNGPNTVGNVEQGGINTVFIDASRSNSNHKDGKRNCAIICQSGAFMCSRISDLAPAVLPKISVSVGNQLDLSVTDFLEYYVDRPDIDSFGLYVEGLSDGEGIRMMNLVRHAKELGKTVIIYKAGRSQAGIRAAKGHTAAMAGDFKMFKSLLEHAGAIVCETLAQWNQLVILSTLVPEIAKISSKRKLGVALLTNAGFEKCACADHLMQNGMEKYMHLPVWTPETLEKIHAIYKKNKIGEVVDVSEVLDVTPMLNDKGYYELTKAILEDPGCDVAIISAVPETQNLKALNEEIGHPKGIFNFIKELHQKYPNKPLIGVFECSERYSAIRRELNRNGIPAFESIDAASRAVVDLVRAAARP